jgi:RNA polymerase sigma-70 factor (sigma-E family)
MMQMVIAGREPEGATLDKSPSIDVEFALFFSEAHRPMLSLAYLLTGSKTQAEEAVQHCFAKVFERWTRIDDPAAYLRRAVVNRCASWHRHRAVVRRTQSAVATDESYNDHPDELRDVLDALPPRRRAVVILRFYEGLDTAEIAGTLAVSEGTVKSTLHRALEQMKGTLR